ncbi:sigma-70 family RNA polymerase sigma factor [Brevibacillus sp. SYP-B805]|uniref:RNA polymerase sigma factor n=1 Tax=Brevibacillus sp. SYP-B805 TaxID=1578199 RepID=UPI0013EDC646|nr:sigma-70 family RNA polymerase sigma factor [Brevibacillus sp. SYP-B805]NGQ96803.1 sigma-70 family RNA polymerase sigma factor [Brevibacillus sp. SYP-B805]
MDEDKEWVADVLRGNKQAYAHLINKYKNKIYAVLLRMVHHPQDAQDLTQECFIKAYHYLHSYDTSRSFSGWLYRIAVNLCIDTLRKQSRYPAVEGELDESAIADQQSPESVYLKKESASEVHGLIQELPETYRIVLLLRYMDDLTYQEISDILNLPLHTVQVRLHRAKQKLREHFLNVKKGGQLHEMF